MVIGMVMIDLPDQRHHMMDGDGKRKSIHEAKVLAQLLSDRECSQSTWEIR